MNQVHLQSPPPDGPETATPIVQWVDYISEWLAASVAARQAWILLGISAAYLFGTGALAWSKQFWFDEILTYHIARLPTLASLWSALRDGLDLNPPLFFLVTRFTRAMLGESELALRVPALIGFWLMCLCLYRFVSRACNPLYALAAMLLPVCTGAYDYATEARPYGMVMGLCGVALIGWQSYARDHSRLGLAVVWLSMTAAISCHYYASMAVLPLAAGEFVRMRTQKKADFKVLGALALAGIPILFFLPQLRSARALATSFFSKPTLYLFLRFDNSLLGPGVFFLAIALVSAAILGTLRNSRRDLEPPRQASAGAEIVVAAGFVLLPYIAMAFAAATGSGFAPRYGLISVLGVAALVPLALHTASRGRSAMGAALVIVFFSAFGLQAAWASRWYFKGKEALEAYNFLSEDSGGLPVVIGNPLQFIKVAHYAPGDWKQRAVYVVSLSDSVRYYDSDTADRALLQLRRITPLNVFDYQEFVQLHPRFLVFGGFNWEIRYLADHHADIRVVGHYEKDLLLEVQLADRSGSQ